MKSRLRGVLTAGTALVAAAAVGIGWATSSVAAQSRYVTAVASTGDVSQSFWATGTVSRENLVAAAFGVSGTVKQLKVGVGDTVAAGDVLATLDTAALKLALLNAETALASAKANLYAAEHPSSSASGSRGSSGVRSPSASGSGTSTGGASGIPSVPSGITAADAATLYEAIAALNVATLKWSNTDQPTTCDLIYAALLDANEAEPETTDPDTGGSADEPADPGTDAGSGGSDDSGESSGTDHPADGGDPGNGDEAASQEPSVSDDAPATDDGSMEADDDTEQLALVIDDITLADIKACGQAREQLLLANAVLADYYRQLITTGTIAGEDDPDDGTTASTPSAPSSGSSSPATSAAGSASTSVSARAVASAEADVLRSQQAVDAAETSLANAELVAPIAGTVGAISLAAGAGSSGGTVTIVGEGTALVSIEVPLATRTLLSQGMAAAVTPAGATDSLAGTVSNISILETSGTAGDNPTYATTIAVSDPGLVLKEGARADVEIITATASAVVTVPASAVTPTGAGTGTVQVLDSVSSDTAETITVATGAVGGGRVEITDGLSEGRIVVLSDRTASIDSLTASTTTSSRRTGGFALPR